MTGAHGERPTWPTLPRRVSRAATVISCAAAFLIAFLNPLLCLIHCAFAHQHATLTSEQQVFLCNLGHSTASTLSAPFSAVWSGPRAVYPALPVAPPMLVVILVVVIWLAPLTTGVCIYIPPPSFPPPKARQHLAVR